MTTFHEKGWNFFHENLSKGNPLDYVLEYMPENKGNFLMIWYFLNKIIIMQE